MRKLTAFLFIVGTLCRFSTTAQEKIHFESKDPKINRPIDVTILSKDPDEGRNSCIYVGLFLLEGNPKQQGSNQIGFSKYGPGKYFINIVGGYGGGVIDGSYFFTTKEKESYIKNSLAVDYGYGGSSVKYVGKIPLIKRTAFGLHGGAGYHDFSSFNNEYDDTYSTMSIFGGISLLKAKHIDITVDDIENGKSSKKGTLIKRLNADVIYYFGQKFVRGKGADPSVPPSEDLATMTRNIGFRIYVDGRASIWNRKGIISVNYMYGIGRSSYASVLPISLILGLGLGYTF